MKNFSLRMISDPEENTMEDKVSMVSLFSGMVGFKCNICDETFKDPEDVEDIDYHLECPTCKRKLTIFVNVEEVE